MGLLDGLLGEVLGGLARGGNARGLPDLGGMGGRGRELPGLGGVGAGGVAAIIAIALQLLQQSGGLESILGRLREKGHAREADSWVSTGPNLPIPPDELAEILGRERIDRAAEAIGVSPEDAAGGLASVLPEIVDRMTPQGRVESGSDDVVAQALEMLQRQRR